MPLKARVCAAAPLVSWTAGALASLVITGSPATPTVQAAVRPPPPLLTDGVTLVTSPPVATLTNSRDRVTSRAVLSLTVTAGVTVHPISARWTLQLTVDPPGPRSTLTLSKHMMALSRLSTIALFMTVLSIETCRAGDIAVKT